MKNCHFVASKVLSIKASENSPTTSKICFMGAGITPFATYPSVVKALIAKATVFLEPLILSHNVFLCNFR